MNIDGGAIALGHPLGRDRRAHHRQGGQPARSARARAMRWRPSASAAARASPPCWSASDADDPPRRRHRRRRDGRGHRRPGRQCGRARAAARHRPRRGGGPQCHRGERRRANAQGGPAAVHAHARRTTGRDRQHRGRHLAKLAGCDWIVEAVVERLDAKQALYRRHRAGAPPGYRVSAPTPRQFRCRTLVAGMPEAFARDFLITHFFNPPRYMRLLEIVAGAASDPATVDAVAAFADVALGKSIVRCKDTSGLHRQPPRHLLDAARGA